MQIRPVHAEDVPELSRIIEAAYRGTGGWTSEVHLVSGNRISQQEIHDLIADPEVSLLAATDDDGTLLGCCYSAAHGADAEFGLFAVDPAVQATGCGKALLAAQVEVQRRRGARNLFIYVLQGRPELVAWYRRRGFVDTGETTDFPSDPGLLTHAGSRMIEMALPLQPGAGVVE